MDKQLSIKELARELGRSVSYVRCMIRCGFNMPNRRASARSAMDWLIKNPNPSGARAKRSRERRAWISPERLALLDAQGERLAAFLEPYSLSFDKVAAVYVLIRDGDIIYVGQTFGLLRRLGGHVDRRLKFDMVRVLIVEKPTKPLLLAYEKALIVYLKPSLNRMFTPRR